MSRADDRSEIADLVLRYGALLGAGRLEGDLHLDRIDIDL